MKIWLRILLISFVSMYAITAFAGLFDAFLVPPEPTPEQVAAQKAAESKAKDERMKDPLIIKAALCNPYVEGLDQGIWRSAYAGISYSDYKFTQLNNCDVTKEQWSAIQKRMKDFYVYKKSDRPEEYIFRMGEWEAEKPLIVSEYENKKNSIDAQLNILDESERRKNPKLAKAFDCTIEIPEGQKHWRDFSGQFVYAPDCKISTSEKLERIALLNSTYYPYLPVANELSQSEVRQRLEDGSDAFLKDMSYFSNQASAAQSLKRAELLKSGKIQVTSMEDAVLFYSDSKGDLPSFTTIATNPLVQPNNSISGGRAQVDFIESNGTLRCKMISDTPTYFWLRLNKGSKPYGNNQLAIGKLIGFIGKYVDNMQYTLVSGAQRTGPVFEVLHYTAY